jgi:hypothetical protein
MARPARSVRALFDYPLQRNAVEWEPRFFGTCFFVHDDATVMTAAHNVRDADAQGIDLGVHVDWADGYILVAVSRWWLSRAHDIAVGRLGGPVAGAEPLPIASEQLAMNEDVHSLEYSQSSWRQYQSGGRRFHVRLSMRKGNIVEVYRDDNPGPIEAEYCEVSFPAFKGASGAPVFGGSTPRVVGMVLQNRERELLPAQTLRHESEDGVHEETKYFLHNAKAISYPHLACALTAALEDIAG